MRGTEGITVGRTSPAFSTIFSSDSTKAAVAPVANQTASITLANECAMREEHEDQVVRDR